MSRVASRLEELGLTLPPVSKPVANYLSLTTVGNLVFVGGHGPFNGDEIVIGKVGGSLSLEDGKRAAGLTTLSILATLKAEFGDLDQIRRFIKVFGMVNVEPGFDQMPAVMDGCSDLLVDVFGDAGRHTRTAVGMAELPFGIAVEIELIAQIR